MFEMTKLPLLMREGLAVLPGKNDFSAKLEEKNLIYMYGKAMSFNEFSRG
jgi:hypothetical protein